VSSLSLRSVTATELISHYGLLPHPEGGFYRETYRASDTLEKAALPERFAGACVASTAIYFLLPKGHVSHLHRIASDEVWHFYTGGPLVVVAISPEGALTQTRLGQHLQDGEVFQHVVPAGYWFGAYPAETSDFSFVGCTVAPGFEFADFELAQRDAMLALCPAYAELIHRLT
jgi:uncharacterized protein